MFSDSNSRFQDKITSKFILLLIIIKVLYDELF